MQADERDPHQLIEGTLIAAYALGVAQVFIYLRGEFALVLMKGRGKGNEWLLIKKKDAEAKPGWKLAPFPTAVITGGGVVPVTIKVTAMEAGLPVAPAAAICTDRRPDPHW